MASRARTTTVTTAACLGAVLALAGGTASAQAPADVLSEGAREQSCKTLTVSTVGIPDEFAADAPGGLPSSWPAAPDGTDLPPEVLLRTTSESFNRLYEFAARAGSDLRRADADPPIHGVRCRCPPASPVASTRSRSTTTR